MVVLFKNIALHNSYGDDFSNGVVAQVMYSPNPSVPPIEIAFDCAEDAARWYTGFSELSSRDKNEALEYLFNIVNADDKSADNPGDKPKDNSAAPSGC